MSYGPQKAYDLIVSYTAEGQDLMASRIYAESRISFKRYQAARAQGLRRRQQAETRMTENPEARNTTTITPEGDQ